MDYVLNVGLAIPHSNELLTPTRVFGVLARYGMQVRHMQHTQSHTEPTLIIEGEFVGRDNIEVAIYCASAELRQDAIAGFLPSEQRGVLKGPRAHEWGDFNPEYFFVS